MLDPTGPDALQQMRALFDQTPGFIAFMRGPTHIFELTNPGYVKLIHGREVLGKPIREAMPELEGQGYFEFLDRVLATGVPFEGRGMKVGLFENGVPRDAFVDFVYQPILGLEGTPVGILVQGVDVTEEKLATMRQSFVTRAAEAIVNVSDMEAALAEVAHAAAQTLADYAIIDLLDRNESRRPVVATASPEDAAIAEAIRTWPLPAPVPATHVFHTGKGATMIVPTLTEEMIRASSRAPAHEALMRRVDIRSAALIPLWHRGHLYGLLSLLTTTRSGRRYDDSYEHAFTQVGRLASSALDNKRLTAEREVAFASERTAREIAETANRAKDDFLAMLGHELRNPLAPILTAVQLMRARGETGSHREQAIIERQALHLVRIVDDLLDISRIVHHKLDLRTAPVELASVVARAIETTAPGIEKRGHQLVTHVEPDLVVLGDEARLVQIVVNLLTNSTRYTPESGRILLTVERDGGAAAIRVRDNGVGIAPETIGAVFDMFVQAPQASDRALGGLGVGLTLVREIAQLHGGTAHATSAGLGQGTEVIVRLPLLGEAQIEAARRTPSTPRIAVKRILVVDDNTDAAMLLGDILEHAGHVITVAHDGFRALELLRTETFEVAILDIGLPGMNGYELARAIREEHGHDKAPRLVALTGYGAQGDRERSAAAGFAEHLTKPVDSSTLLRALHA